MFVHYCKVMVCVLHWVGKWQSRGSTGMFGNLMAIHYIMLQFQRQHGLCSLCIMTSLEKHEVIHKELSDLFPQLAQTWQTWGCNALETITLTSQWARWRLKSPASLLFTQLLVQARIKDNIKAPRHWPLRGECTGDQWVPLTKGLRKMFLFDDVIVISCIWPSEWNHSIYQIHYTGATWALWRPESVATLLIVQQLLRVNK